MKGANMTRKRYDKQFKVATIKVILAGEKYSIYGSKWKILPAYTTVL